MKKIYTAEEFIKSDGTGGFLKSDGSEDTTIYEVALGFTAENIANKSDSYTASSSTTYASTKALVDGLGVAQKDIVYVDINGSDSTGVLGNIRKPFLTIDAALDALPSTGGVVNIGIGSFNSPSYLKIKPNTTFKGSGKPSYNNTVTGGASYPLYTKTTATALVGGTILLGTFRFPLGDGFKVIDLGVDCGPVWCTTFNGGVAAEGFMMANDVVTNTPQNGKLIRKNIIIKNVATIVNNPSDLVHGFVVENCFEPYVSNVDTYNGFAGFVYKNIGGSALTIKVQNSGSLGLVIKNNSYAYGNSMFLNDFEIDGGAGLTLDTDAELRNVYISNGRIRNTDFGVKQTSGTFYFVNISNIHVNNVTGYGFDFTDLQAGNLLNNSATFCGSGGFRIIGDNNRLSENRATLNTGIGISLTANNLTYPSISTGNDSSNNSTYGFSYSGFIKGGHNTGASNSTALVNGTITLLDPIPMPLALSGAPGSYLPVLDVENTGTGALDKNIAIYRGNAGSSTNVDDNTTLGVQQKETTPKNYSVLGFFNAAGNTSAQIVARNISHGASQGSIAFNVANSSVLSQAMEIASSGHILIGKPEFTGATNNDTGEKLQVVGNIIATSYNGTATLTGTPTAPTATAGTNTTQIATTAFVHENTATNTTTVVLDSATLTATYPTAIRGFKVHALDILVGGRIYEKTSTGWCEYLATITA